MLQADNMFKTLNRLLKETQTQQGDQQLNGPMPGAPHIGHLMNEAQVRLT